MQIIAIIFHKILHMCNLFCNFAANFGNNRIINGKNGKSQRRQT